MARFVYGDSYADVANREMAMDAARDARLFNSLASNRADQQLALADEQNRSAQAMSMLQFLAGLGEQRRRDRLYSDRLSGDRNLDLLRLAMSGNQFNRQLAQSKELKEAELESRYGDEDYAEAVDAIQQGLIEPGKLTDAFPRLTDTQLKRLTTYRQNLESQENEDIKSAETLTKTLNDMLASAKWRNAERAKVLIGQKEAKKGFNPRLGTVPFFGQTPWYDLTEEGIDANTQARLSALGEEVPLSDFIDSILRNRAYSGRVLFDPESQEFVPAPVSRRFAAAPAVPPATAAAPVAGPERGTFIRNLMGTVQPQAPLGANPMALPSGDPYAALRAKYDAGEFGFGEAGKRRLLQAIASLDQQLAMGAR